MGGAISQNQGPGIDHALQIHALHRLPNGRAIDADQNRGHGRKQEPRRIVLQRMFFALFFGLPNGERGFEPVQADRRQRGGLIASRSAS